MKSRIPLWFLGTKQIEREERSTLRTLVLVCVCSPLRQTLKACFSKTSRFVSTQKLLSVYGRQKFPVQVMSPEDDHWDSALKRPKE